MGSRWFAYRRTLTHAWQRPEQFWAEKPTSVRIGSYLYGNAAAQYRVNLLSRRLPKVFRGLCLSLARAVMPRLTALLFQHAHVVEVHATGHSFANLITHDLGECNDWSAWAPHIHTEKMDFPFLIAKIVT